MPWVAGGRCSPRMPPYDPLNLRNQSEPLREKIDWVGDLLELGLELGVELVSGLCELFSIF